MIMQNLKKETASGMRIKKGMVLKCLCGTVWITACGEDIILKGGNSVCWNRRSCRIAVVPIGTDAVVALSREPSLFEEFSLFNNQPRLTCALAG